MSLANTSISACTFEHLADTAQRPDPASIRTLKPDRTRSRSPGQAPTSRTSRSPARRPVVVGTVDPPNDVSPASPSPRPKDRDRVPPSPSRRPVVFSTVETPSTYTPDTPAPVSASPRPKDRARRPSNSPARRPVVVGTLEDPDVHLPDPGDIPPVQHSDRGRAREGGGSARGRSGEREVGERVNGSRSASVGRPVSRSGSVERAEKDLPVGARPPSRSMSRSGSVGRGEKDLPLGARPPSRPMSRNASGRRMDADEMGFTEMPKNMEVFQPFHIAVPTAQEAAVRAREEESGRRTPGKGVMGGRAMSRNGSGKKAWEDEVGEFERAVEGALGRGAREGESGGVEGREGKETPSLRRTLSSLFKKKAAKEN